MSTFIVTMCVIFSCVRLLTLFISINNEKALKKAGAKEYGRFNSIILTTLHILFYFSACVEGYIKRVQYDQVTIIGIIIYVSSMLALFYVIQKLSQIWTVKLIIAEDHPLDKSFLFRYIRHPNYFLNIIPELIGWTLLLKSYVVFSIIFPVYMVSLSVRIKQEEKLMKLKFSDY